MWSAGGRYVDPLADTNGPEGFAAMVASTRAQHPGLALRRASAVDTHHDTARFRWEAVGPDGSVVSAGIDVALVSRDGKLGSITGFIGEPAAVEVTA